jgi:hypothetical protein
MTEKAKATVSGPAAEVDERRVWIRYSCELESSCQPILGSGLGPWQAVVKNISRGGIRLTTTRRFEARTVLHVDLPAAGNDGGMSVLARVVKVTAEPDGTWALGCVLARELGSEEMNELLRRCGSET